MNKAYILLFIWLFLNTCFSQTNHNSETEKSNLKETLSKKEIQNGIVYFSYNNGSNWVNASNGLPQQIRIGLGGISSSNQLIGLATKENGVYLYNFHSKTWKNIPTDKQIIEANLGAIALIGTTIFVGTQNKGVFFTNDKGRTWQMVNNGLNNLTIRRFSKFNQILFVCTNDGFYSLDSISNQWKKEFAQNGLQTNGVTLFKGRFYLATNKGIFSQLIDKSWVNLAPKLSMHNISSDNHQIFAMTYNEMLLSSADGVNWQKQQNGLPKNLYTFNVLNHNNLLLASQWDGIYRKNKLTEEWKIANDGLPINFAVTNLLAFNKILVISTSERKLKQGMTTDK